MPIKVVIADDHELFRDGLKMMLDDTENIELCGEAIDGRALIELVNEHKPDVVVTDIRMPGLDGVEATKHIKEHFEHIEVVALSMFDDEELIMEMLEAGAIGYLLKNSDKPELVEAIHAAFDHEPYYCKHTSRKLTKLIAMSKAAKQKKEKEAEFTDKEKEIIRLICQEFTNKEIGKKLFLSTRTIEGYRMKILEKMDVKNTVGIVIEAMRLGIYEPDLH